MVAGSPVDAFCARLIFLPSSRVIHSNSNLRGDDSGVYFLACIRPQSVGQNARGQKSGVGLSNSKVTAKNPSRELLTSTTLQACLTPTAGFASINLCPLGTFRLISSKPPWAFTTKVNASRRTSFPRSTSVSTITRICSGTRSLRLRFMLSSCVTDLLVPFAWSPEMTSFLRIFTAYSVVRARGQP